MTAKKLRQFRLSDETVNQIDFLINSLGHEVGLNFDRTKVIEKIVHDAYFIRKENSDSKKLK